MFSNILKSVFCSLLSKIAKRGFTLAEALIITVMTGACLLPILGTMQNAQIRTENYDHQSKMQQYARSRLTAEIANAAFDHKSINLEDEYHYIVYFAPGTPGNEGSEDDAKLIELPKTYATLEDMASLTADTNGNWATAAIDLLGIKRADKKPYLQVVHAYKTSVEIKNNPALAEYGNDSNVIDSPKALLGIVVKTCLIKSNDNFYDPADGALITSFNTDGSINTTDKDSSVLPVTLFSFVNLPTVSDEMIWLADALNCVIYGIDPISRGVTTIPLPRSSDKADAPEHNKNDPFRPWHIAVHPSLKLLAVMMQEKIVLVNIDSKGPLKYDVKDTTLTKTNLGKNICTIDKEYKRAYEDGGICFRPDGKVLFFTQTLDKENSKIYAYELKSNINPTSNVLSWEKGADETPYLAKLSTSVTSCSLKDDIIVGLKPSNDGYLYVALKEVPKEKNSHDKKGGMIYRFPMYLSDWSSWAGEEFAFLEDKKYLSIDVSPDGNRLAAITETDGLLIEYDTKSKTQIYNPLTIKNGDKMPTPFKNAYVSISDKDTDYTSKKSLSVAVTSKTEIKKSLVGNFESNTSTPFRCAKVASGTEGGFVVVSPNGKNIVANDKKKPWIYFWNTGTTNSEDSLTLENNGISEFILENNSSDPKKEKGYTSLETTKRDILAAGFENNNIKLYDLNTFNELEDEGFVATYSLSDLAMNNLGNMLLSSHGNNTTGCFQYNITDGSTVKPTVNVYRRKAVFDDSWPNMGFALQYEKDNSGDITNEGFVNLYYSVSDRWETVATDIYDRRNFVINPEWKGLDMIGMPNGGAMVLYGKADGSSMVEWIGRRNWGSSNVGKYRLFARWTNIYTVSGTDFYLPYSNLTSFNTADSDFGVICRLVSALEPNTEVNSVDFQAANGGRGLNFNDDSTRCITPIVLKKEINGKFTIANYATNKISTQKGETHLNVSITWKYPFRISRPDTYYLGWWNGFEAESTKGVIGYDVNDDDNVNPNAKVIANFGWASAKTLQDLILQEINDTSPKKRNYNINFKITPVQSVNTEFPPLFSRKLAISPDCGTLAVLATNTSNIPVVNFYDFNNQIYGPETQIEGLLLDYRKPKDSGKISGSVVRQWPEETGESLFGKVEDNCDFNNNGTDIFNLKKCTTKYETWASFNDLPCNYYADNSDISNMECKGKNRGYANKRFIGYIRPESAFSFMQMYFTDEPRVFINNSLIYGTVERGPVAFINNSVPVCLNSYSSNLFQLDQASNKGDMKLSLFFNRNNVSISSLNSKGNDTYTHHYDLKSSDITNGWSSLESKYTYILNNKPVFMGSRKLQSPSSGSKLDLSHGDMLFSRDRAMPVLYIKGKIYLWIIYNNKLIRAKVGANLLHNFALSSDGQKIICGRTHSSKNYISVFNISSPNESLFTEDGNEFDLNTNANTYLCEIASFPVDSTPQYLTTKPLTSYNSSKIGGKYKSLNATSTFTITPNSAAAASGGIYLFRANQDMFAIYNPLSNKLDIKGSSKKNMYSSVIAAYNDIIYSFGNAGDGTNQNPRSGMVQSYNINTDKALTSLNEAVPETSSIYTDSYQVSMGYVKSGCSNFIDSIGDYLSGSNVDDPKKAFVYLPESYTRTTNTNPYIDIKFNSPLTVNKLLITNHKPSSDTNSSDKSVRKFKLEGANSSSFTTIKTIDDVGEHGMDINSSSYFESIGEHCFKTYRLHLTHVKGTIKTIAGAISGWITGEEAFHECSKYYNGTPADYKYDGVVNLIQLWRTGVKRLTPSVKEPSFLGVPTEQNVNSVNWTIGTFTSTLEWSENNSSGASLRDVFVPGSSSNDVENNVFTSEPHGWNCSKTYPSLRLVLPNPEAVCAVRYANSGQSGKGRIVKFELYGNNDVGADIPNVDDDNDIVDPKWGKPIEFTNNLPAYYGPNIVSTFITAEVKAPRKYRNYLVRITEKSEDVLRLIGFEMFSSPEKDELPSEDYMTPMKNDNLGDINLSDGAACATPYGLVYTGGFDGADKASKTALLYWPHAINKYDGHYNQYGISRSLPNMKYPRANHVLVWHKGKIYAIGGRFDTGDGSVYDNASFTEVLDYNNSMEWEDYSKPYKYVDGANAAENYMAKRYNHGACSFGDEIFIFGGLEDSSYVRNSAVAFNPDTGVVRKLTDLSDVLGSNVKLNPCVAVPFGSKIYIFGMYQGSLKILEYTP